MGAPLKVEAIAQALEASVGNISHAARSLKVTRQTLYNRIKESPTLKAALEDARETALDNAESALQSAVLAKEAWAVCFTLKTIGKGRGYVERNEVDYRNFDPDKYSREQLEAIAAGKSPSEVGPPGSTGYVN
jgi:hypothetical protein